MLSLFLYVALARAMEENAFSLLRREAGDARVFLAPFVVQGVPLAKAAEAVEVAKAPGVGVVLLERDGLVAAKARAAARVPLPDPSPDAIAALKEGGAEWRRIVELRERIGEHEEAARTAVLMLPLRQPPRRSPVFGVGPPAPGQRVADPPAPAQRRADQPAALIRRSAEAPQAPPPPFGTGPPLPSADATGQRACHPGAAPEKLPLDRVWTKPADFLIADPMESGDVVGFVQVSMSMDTVDATLRTVRLLLAGGVGATLLLALVVGLPLTRVGLRPLRAVAGASRRLAEGDLSTRVPPAATRDEVGDLADAFNEMAERLEAAFAAQRAFVADASHELRTPLTALGGQLDVFVRAAREHPLQPEQLARTMRGEVDRMTRLVEELLTLARLDAKGAEALHLARVDLGSVARDVYEEARALPAARGKQLHLEANGPLAVRADPARLHQVLLNLTVNALQHTPSDGAIRLSLERRNGHALVTVRDSGPGIPPEHLPQLFDRFYRADHSRARDRGGAGLGLAIAQAIAQAHGGELTAENADEGGRCSP